MRPRILAVGVLTIAMVLPGAPPTLAHGNEGDTPTLPWTHLRFSAKKLFWTAETRIDLEPADPSSLATTLIAAPGSDALPAPPPVLQLSVASAFAGRRDHATLWFDPETGRAFQRRKVREGKKAYTKTYRFTREGVFSHRRSPTDDERDRPSSDWSNLDTRTFPHRPDRCAVVTEPTALLHRVSLADLELGDRVDLCAFSNKQTQRLVLRVEEALQLEVDHQLSSPGTTPRQRRETIEVLRLRIGPADEAAEGFELLGLEGEVDLYVDRRYRLPVRLEGRLGSLGRLRVDLEEAVLPATTP